MRERIAKAMATLPRIDNLIPNPSAEVNTTGWAALASTTRSRVTTWDWVGAASFRLVASAAVATIGMTTPTLVADANRVVIAAGKPASLRSRVMTPQASRRARLVVEWRTSASALISTDTGAYVNLTANTPADVWLEGLTAPVTTAFASVRVEFAALAGNVAISDTLSADGIQLSPTETVQTYADGSLGSGFNWAGTAHLSASWRDALTIRQTRARGGITRISSELWLANTDGTLLENITPLALEGKVTANVNNTIKTALAISVRDPGSIVPYSSVVAPIINLTDVEGNTERHQVGLYITTPAKQTHKQTHSTGQIEGRGLAWILENDYFGTSYSLAAGTNYVAAVIAILAAKGLRYSIPATTLTLPFAKTWPPDVSKLTIVNDLLNGAGYYTIWSDRYGVLKSVPYVEMASAHPALQLFSGEGSLVIEAIEQEGVYETLANKIIVYKENTQGASIRVTRTNNDPASAVSTVSLGRTITRVIKDSNIADVATAQAIAKRAIEEASSSTSKLKVTTLPVPDRELHEVYDLAIYNAEGLPIGFGLWWCDSWELGFTTKSAKMTHNLKRLEPYGWDEVIA